MPKNKVETRRLQTMLATVTDENPLQLFVGSCPDYSHQGGLYTHESLGEDIPLLTRYHVENIKPVLKIFDAQEIPYLYTIMVADVEATDEVFCKRFTHGSEEEFLRRCAQSTDRTKEYTTEELSVSNVVSSSFFGVFGRERFMILQEQYQEVLLARHKSDSSFRMRVISDMLGRYDMYQHMYGNITSSMSLDERTTFLAGRTIRTMAQYLTLGRLVAEKSEAAIINHPTRNFSIINQRNKFLLPTDGLQPQPAVPVLEMERRVY